MICASILFDKLIDIWLHSQCWRNRGHASNAGVIIIINLGQQHYQPSWSSLRTGKGEFLTLRFCIALSTRLSPPLLDVVANPASGEAWFVLMSLANELVAATTTIWCWYSEQLKTDRQRGLTFHRDLLDDVVGPQRLAEKNKIEPHDVIQW